MKRKIKIFNTHTNPIIGMELSEPVEGEVYELYDEVQLKTLFSVQVDTIISDRQFIAKDGSSYTLEEQENEYRRKEVETDFTPLIPTLKVRKLEEGRELYFHQRIINPDYIKCTVISWDSEKDENDPMNFGYFPTSTAKVRFEDGKVQTVPFSMLSVKIK